MFGLLKYEQVNFNDLLWENKGDYKQLHSNNDVIIAQDFCDILIVTS